MDPAELAFAGVARQAELVRAGEVSSRELVSVYLERIERLDPELNAFRTVYAEQALAEAEQADARREQAGEQPLLGVPVAIKDNLDVAADVTGHGTEANDRPASEDSEVVRRLRGAGCVLLGKTRLSELAMWPFTLSSMWGVTRNPWDPSRTPGGSSGGSGAAVAAGLAPAATASDGGGSIRVPAAFCGLFGLKPQRGRVSLAPLAEHWYGLTAGGFLTRSVMDTALLLDAVAGPAADDAHRPPPPPRPYVAAARAEPGRLRVGLAMKPGLVARVEAPVRGAARSAADLLESLGHEVGEASPSYGELTHLFTPLYLRGIRDDAAALDRPARLERRSRGMARLGGLVPRWQVERARKGGEERAARIQRVFEDFDVLLTPHPASLPLVLERVVNRGLVRTFAEAANLVAFDSPWNITGQPAASVPAGFSSEGLPLSVQLVGRPDDEGTLLSLAAQIESARPWAGDRPPIS